MRAYVFVSDENGWSQQQYLKARYPDEYDNFGWPVSISGDVIVVGAPSEDSGSSDEQDGSVPGAGAVYLFERNGTTWTQQNFLKSKILINRMLALDILLELMASMLWGVDKTFLPLYLVQISLVSLGPLEPLEPLV
jgi:hypothetical protein